MTGEASSTDKRIEGLSAILFSREFPSVPRRSTAVIRFAFELGIVSNVARTISVRRVICNEKVRECFGDVGTERLKQLLVTCYAEELVDRSKILLCIYIIR